ncbi:MAG: HAD-IIA family hydrolase, partial [Candidatus Atribacteria bacterium]|nr:HAD-IIA family hydrolase [Candidatus Atribacteria bacterium]
MGIDWDQVTNFIIDMDGVIYRGKQPIPGSREFILFLRERKAKIAFFSNNSTITSDQFIQKLTGMDIIATKNEFVSSGFITAYNIQKENSSARVFCIGEAGIREELQKAGIRMVDDPPDDRVDYVVVGLDHQFNYAKMAKAMRCILNGARFLGTNPDLTFPLEDGLTPGCGALLASIEACTGVRPRIMGKPHPESIRFLLEITGFQRENSIFIGDRID